MIFNLFRENFFKNAGKAGKAGKIAGENDNFQRKQQHRKINFTRYLPAIHPHLPAPKTDKKARKKYVKSTNNGQEFFPYKA
jgi:hypothetical protein